MVLRRACGLATPKALGAGIHPRFAHTLRHSAVVPVAPSGVVPPNPSAITAAPSVDPAAAAAALATLMGAPTAQAAIEHCGPVVAAAPGLTVAEVGAVAEHMAALHCRHEPLLAALGWAVLHAMPPSSAAARGGFAAATATALSSLWAAGWTNDTVFVAAGVGRLAELAPAMTAATCATALTAVASLRRLQLTQSEADRYAATARAMDSDATFSDAARMLGDDAPAARTASDLLDDVARESQGPAPRRTLEEDLADPVALDLYADAVPAALAKSVNLIDVAADALEAQLHALMHTAAEATRQTAEASPAAEPGPAQRTDIEVVLDGDSPPQDAVRSRPAAKVIVVTATDSAENVSAVVRALSALGVRDRALPTYLAAELTAHLRRRRPEPALLAAVIHASVALRSRVTDVLDDAEAGGDAQLGRALVRSAADALLRLNVATVAHRDPKTVLALRGACERAPWVAEANPALWDALRTAKATRLRIARMRRAEGFNWEGRLGSARYDRLHGEKKLSPSPLSPSRRPTGEGPAPAAFRESSFKPRIQKDRDALTKRKGIFGRISAKRAFGDRKRGMYRNGARLMHLAMPDAGRSM